MRRLDSTVTRSLSTGENESAREVSLFIRVILIEAPTLHLLILTAMASPLQPERSSSPVCFVERFMKGIGAHTPDEGS